MNKFRNNLHSAFFDPENEFASQKREYYDRVSNPEEQELEQEVHEETEEVKENIVQNPEFSNVAGTVASEVSSKYTDTEQFKRDSTRFRERITSKSDNGKGEEYNKVWEKKIRKGFDDLIKALEENKYFDDCKDNEAKTQKIADITVKYSKEIHSQYEKYIWSAGNKTFNSIKDSIFGQNSQENPANKIYKELTGAAAIFRGDRTYVEGYDSDVLDWGDIDENDENENMTDKQNRNFLSNDLPMYLWNVKKSAPNRLSWVPIISAKIDKPSKEDRKAINKFLKASSKINVEGNKDKAVALMEVFHDNALNTDKGKDDYKAILAKHGVSVDDKDISEIIDAGNFYIRTQRTDNNTRDQHAIYLSVLKIIENEGGVNNAVNKFKSIVEQAKSDKKTEKKEGYQSGEKLGETNPELYDIAKKLGITDFSGATRLSEKSPEYFTNTPIEKILANLNNDRTIDARDTFAGGSKTGAQFLEIFKQVSAEIGDKKLINETTGEESIIKGSSIVLNNLANHAKLLNKALGVGLPDVLFNDTFEENIKSGHTGLILLLQNIINRPGEDLYTLLSGHPENPFEGIDLAAEKASADKTATEMVGKMDLEALKKEGLRLQTPESMQSGLATALYTEYKRGIGLGGKVSFDQWIKGVELNAGFQVRNDGTVIRGLGLDYHKKINLGKGWSTTPELSVGGFIPLGMGRIEEVSGSVGLNNEVAKERITKKGIKEHLGVQGGITLMPAGVFVVSAGINWEQNKLEGIEPAEQIKMVEFRDNIISPILNKLYEERKQIKSPNATRLDLNDAELVKSIRSIILAKTIDEKVPADDRENVIDATMRLLVNYNGVDLAQEGVRDIIAQGVAEQYAMAWAEDRKAHISDKAYLSGASLGAFWVVGSPLVGIYVGLKVTKHDVDGYGDRWGKERETSTETQGPWNQEMLDRFNQQLGLSEKDKLRLENGFVVIPASFINRVNVNEKMAGLMKKGANGDILLNPRTPMAVDIRRGAATQGTEILVGGKKGGKFSKLDTLGDNVFTTGDIDQNKVFELGEIIEVYTADTLDKALIELRKNFPEGDPIQHFDFNVLPPEKLQEFINKLNALDKNKKARISIINNNGVLEVSNDSPKEGDTGKGLEIEYQTTVEMVDNQVKDIAESVYAEADKVTCNVLTLMCHHLKGYKDRRRPDYLQFAEAMNNRDYIAAKPKIIDILNKLDTEINKQQKNNPVDFSAVATKIEAITDEISLGQALMSVNNIFARSIKVIGKGQEEIDGKKISRYGLTLPMGNIIAERENQIKGTVSDKVEEPGRSAYLALIEASKKYRIANKDKFNVKESRAAQLNNTVGFNLGNSVNPENPLFNPEIFEQTVNMKDLENLGFGAEQRNALHERAMKLYAENPSLINPILKALRLEGKDVEVKGFSTDGEKGKLILDIGGKKVTLSAGMGFGYFTQCVNHTVILHDLEAEIEGEGGASVTFNSGVWESGRYKEGNKSTIVSTTTIGVTMSVTIGKEKDEKEPKTEPEDSPVKTDRADDGGLQVATDPSGTTQVDQGLEDAGKGQETISGGDEF